MTWIDIRIEEPPIQIKMKCDWCSKEVWWINELEDKPTIDAVGWCDLDEHTLKDDGMYMEVKHICPDCYKRLLEPSAKESDSEHLDNGDE